MLISVSLRLGARVAQRLPRQKERQDRKVCCLVFMTRQESAMERSVSQRQGKKGYEGARNGTGWTEERRWRVECIAVEKEAWGREYRKSRLIYDRKERRLWALEFVHGARKGSKTASQARVMHILCTCRWRKRNEPIGLDSATKLFTGRRIEKC